MEKVLAVIKGPKHDRQDRPVPPMPERGEPQF